jgi:alpha-amylase
MKNISLTFQVHQPVRLKKYHFFDIGNDPCYYDDLSNERIIRKAADDCYLPTNEILLDLLKKNKGHFQVAFSISGLAIDLFSLYAPEVIESFQKLSTTGCVEFLAEPYCHSLASIKDEDEFRQQVEAHACKMEELFSQRPNVFKNTELIYFDNIGEITTGMGFKAILTEGARHILKWRSPNHMYCNSINQELKVLLRNIPLSEDISFRLSNPQWTGWAVTANNYLDLFNKIPSEEKIINLFLDYELVCEGQRKGCGIFNFLKSFPQAVFEMTEYGFMTPSELACYYQPVSSIEVPKAISSAPYEKDLTLFQGNELQREALEKLYGLKDKVKRCTDPDLLKDWQYLQTSDHFFYMCSNFFPDPETSSNHYPYENPYEAFMNYMNILNDFTIRINRSILNMKSDFVMKKKYQPAEVMIH